MPLHYVVLESERGIYLLDVGNKRGEARFPAEDLFVWAVLMHQQDLAKLFWKQGKVSAFVPRKSPTPFFTILKASRCCVKQVVT